MKRQFSSTSSIIVGEEEFIDPGSEILTEKLATDKSRVVLTPTRLFLPEQIFAEQSGIDAVAGTTKNDGWPRTGNEGD